MLDDKDASELVSKSLRYQLTEEEESAVDQHLAGNEETRKFAEVSRLIQKSISDVARHAEEGDESVAPGLSADAKLRLRQSVANAVLRESQAGATGPTDREGNRTILGGGQPLAKTEVSRRSTSRFNISRKLADGGLGTVWLARDEKLKRTVAIKEMNLEAMESPVAWRRFHREAEITGHLEHPGIVPLYLFGIDSQTQQPFYAMRFVGKRTLADAIVEHHERRKTGEDVQLELHRLLGDFLRICETIAYAHSRGVIHRDLKPDNIALDNFGQVIVLDWGLAKVLDTAELGTQMVLGDELTEDSLSQTVAGEVIGTPLYMSPEQASGDLDAIDPRTDIYGLGAILFSILTGFAPHERTASQTESGTRIREVLDEIAAGETPRPGDVTDGIPKALEDICLRAMARRPYSRFQRATELANAIEDWRAGQTHRGSRYETLRMEGRELKIDFQAGVDDLESNVRFASLLPPVQELIRPENEEEDIVWRDRLTTIFTGLLRSKPGYSRIVFHKIEGGQFTELVRVERHSRDRATIRKVPRSRLRSGETNEFINSVLMQQPEEVLSSLVCDPLCEKAEGCDEPSLVAALPVYDEQTEEPFGVLMIDCDLQFIFDKQMTRNWSAGEILVSCDASLALMHAVDNRIVKESFGQSIVEHHPEFSPALEQLKSDVEFIDKTDQNIYGCRLWLIEKDHGLMYLLKMPEN